MTTLVLGATGATGKLVVEQLIQQHEHVRLIVRAAENLPANIRQHEQVTITCASVLDLTEQQLTELVQGCDAVISCLGHNMTIKGMFGHPRRLVTDAIKRVCQVIQKLKPTKPVKLILMNTTGNQNKAAGEKVSIAHTLVVTLLRLLLPPHVDNEQAAAYLQNEVTSNSNYIEWVVVRPDSLTNRDQTTPYDVYPSPVRDAIFNSGETSRINVAHFMIELITQPELWKKWKGNLPVIYNR